MAKIQPRKLERSRLLDVNGTPFRVAWLIPITARVEKEASEKVAVEGKPTKSVLARMRETPSGFEGYALRSKTPLLLREWSASEWRVMEIPTGGKIELPSVMAAAQAEAEAAQ